MYWVTRKASRILGLGLFLRQRQCGGGGMGVIYLQLKRDRVVEENAYCERCISVSAKKLQQQLRGAQCAE